MEAAIIDALLKMGAGGVPTAILFLYVLKSTERRKETRDAEIKILKDKIEAQKESFTRHISHHQDFEKNICHKIDKIYDRLNPISDSVKKIEGYLEAKDGK